MDALEKTPVLNPLTLRNTVGAELADIFEAQGKGNGEELMEIPNLRSKERLTKKEIKKACDLLQTPSLASMLTNFQKKYLSEKPRYVEKYKAVLKSYNKLKGVLPLLRGEFDEGFDLMEDILDFFGVNSDTELFEHSEQQAALFRTQSQAKINSINMLAWLRRGELDCKAMNLPDYQEEALRFWVEQRDWEKHIDDVDYFKSLPVLFATFGVALVFVPALPKTVYGAVRWMDGKPLIQLSDLEHNLVSCWFTLFHEIGHVLMHKNESIYETEINNPKTLKNTQEKEANKFANLYLFHGDELRKAVYTRKKSGHLMTARSLSEEFRVNPILASYWLFKADYQPTFQQRIAIDFVSAYQ